MRIVVVAVLGFGLTGCVTEQMNRGLGFMDGENTQYEVGRLGYHDAKREMLGDTIYVWATNHEVDLQRGVSKWL
jgi:hypothetical protein